MATEVLEWTAVESLKTTDFGSLVVDLKEIEKLLTDLEVRKAAVRKLIVDNYQKTLTETGPIRVQDRAVSWRPPTTQRKLSEKRLILAGVTPDQLARGWDETPKVGYLEVRVVKPEDSI